MDRVKETLMENKKTTELLDLIATIEKKGESDDRFDWDEYGEVCAELRKRFPFSEILGEKDDPNDFTLEEKIQELEETVKVLKRHKHDVKTGDVLIRI